MKLPPDPPVKPEFVCPGDAHRLPPPPPPADVIVEKTEFEPVVPVAGVAAGPPGPPPPTVM